MPSSRKPQRASVADLNRQSAADLMRSMPGVGEVLASRIAEHRETFGPIASSADLARVPGMGARRAERLWASIDHEPTASDHDPEVRSPSSPPSEQQAPPDPPADSAQGQPIWLQLSQPVSASDLPPPADPEPQGERGTHAEASELEPPARRRSLLPAAALALAAVVVGVLGSAALARSVRDSSVALARVDADDVRNEVRELRADVQLLSSAQAGASVVRDLDTGKVDQVKKRLDERDRAEAETRKRVSAVEERTKKVEDKQDKQALRIRKAEDDIAWQKMATSAQLAILKKQVRRAADEIEDLGAE